MQCLSLGAAMLAMSLTMSATAEAQPVAERDIVSICRAAIVEGGFPAIAPKSAQVAWPFVFIGENQVSGCEFELDGPLQLTDVFIIDCYHCEAFRYDDALLSKLNELLLARGAETASAFSADEVAPATDMQFVEMLQGCWNKPTSVGSSTACFFPDGGVAFLAYNSAARDALADGGRYRVEGGKVRIEGTGDAWPFKQNAISCDGFIEPLETLILAQCDGELSDSISDPHWGFESSLEDCHWCDMVRFD